MNKLNWDANEMRWCKKNQETSEHGANEIDEELSLAEIKSLYEEGYYLEKIDENKVNVFGECFFDEWVPMSLGEVEIIIKEYTQLIKILDNEILSEEDFEFVDTHHLLEGIKKMGDSRKYPGFNWYSVILKDETDWDVYYKFHA